MCGLISKVNLYVSKECPTISVPRGYHTVLHSTDVKELKILTNSLF